MLPLVSGLAFNWRIVAAAVVVLVVVGALVTWRADIRKAALQTVFAAELESALAQQRAEVERLNRLLVARDAAVVKLTTANRKLARDLDGVRRRIASAPASDDAPVAPVLRGAIDALKAPR